VYENLGAGDDRSRGVGDGAGDSAADDLGVSGEGDSEKDEWNEAKA
jgi:hypothetical protein